MFGLEAFGDGLLWAAVLLLAKATLVMVGALAISRILLRRDPAARHALWTGTMLVLLLFPVLSVAGTPEIAVPVSLLPGPAGEETAVAQAPTFHLPAAFPAGFEVEISGVPELPPALRGGDAHASDGSAHRRVVGPAAEAASASTTAGRRGSWSQRATTALGLLWGMGAAILLLGLVVGVGRARHLIRHARPAADPGWEVQAKSTALRVGLRRPVPIRIADGLASPMAGGVLKPVVLLPPEAEGWATERREVILLHELVHVRRRDPLRQLLDRLVVALYWFHPLVRRAAREAATAREEACDRSVVNLGAGPSRYASHLVELTDRPFRAPAGLTGFHHPNLEKRIMSILAPSHSPRRGTSVASALLALAWFGAIAVVTPVASQAPPPEPPAAPVSAVQVAAPVPPSPPAESQPPEAAEPAPPTSPLEATDPTTPTSPLPMAPLPSAPGGTDDILTCQLPGMVHAEGARGFRQEREDDPKLTAFRHSSLNGYNVCLVTFGTVDVIQSGLQLGSIAPGSSAEIVVASADGSQRLRIRADDDGQLEEAWFVNDTEQPHGPEVEAWRDALLEYLTATAERGQILAYSARLRGEVARMTGERARLRGEIARARGEVSRLAGERSRLAGEEARLRGQIARLNGETARLRGEIYRTNDPEERRAIEARLRARSVEVEEEVARIRAQIEALDTPTRLARMDEEVEVMRAETARQVDTLRTRLETLEEDHEARTREIAETIEALDAEALVDEIDARLPELRARAIAAIEAIGFEAP